jgi:hypothetical protein
MTRKIVAISLMALLVAGTGVLWAEGGKNRHGQNGTQPRTGHKWQAPERGAGVAVADLQGACVQAQTRYGQGAAAGTQTRKQLRKRDGTCSLAGTQDRKRDRKRDGTC